MHPQIIPNGRFPKFAPSVPFSITAAIVGNTIMGLRQVEGGGNYDPQPFTFLGPDGTPLRVAEEPFELHYWPVSYGPFRLLVRLEHADGLSEWLSADDGSTWTPAADFWKARSG